MTWLFNSLLFQKRAQEDEVVCFRHFKKNCLYEQQTFQLILRANTLFLRREGSTTLFTFKIHFWNPPSHCVYQFSTRPWAVPNLYQDLSSPCPIPCSHWKIHWWSDFPNLINILTLCFSLNSAVFWLSSQETGEREGPDPGPVVHSPHQAQFQIR